MKLKVNRVGFVFGFLIIGGAGLTSSLASGCGGDDTVVNPGDASTDSTTGDARAETGSDANTTPDVSADSVAQDATDAGADVQPIDGAGFVDVGAMADAPPLGDFPHAVDEAYCTRLQQCCLVQPNEWNPNCATLFDGIGGILGQANYNAAFDSGLVVYDAAAAQTCLNYMLSFNCGTVPASAFATVRDLCFGAMQGTLAANAGPCINSLECQHGLYCKLADGGPGTCVPLQGQGQPCTDTIYSTDCTYLGNGTPEMYCATPSDGGTPTCQPALGLDAGCNQAAECQSWSCSYPVCSDLHVFSDPGVPKPRGTCASLTIADAGGGG